MEHDAREVDEMSGKKTHGGAHRAHLTSPLRRRVLVAGLAAGALAAASVAVVVAHGQVAHDTEPAAAECTTGRMDTAWIAYSTAPAHGQEPRAGGIPDDLTGSDIYLARGGSEPRLVAGRADGRTWNVCPAFSPDGTMLAFGVKEPEGRAVRVVGVTREGAIVAPSTRLGVRGIGDAPCPRWSADGSRVAYLEGRRVVVRGLDGSFLRARAGDPAAGDFRRSNSVLVSPARDRVARLETCALTLERPDGSDRRTLDYVGCAYGIAGWSPDGRKLLVMYDVSGFHFAMDAVSVDAPDEVTIAARVRVNHARSWPGHGDVSWQPAVGADVAAAAPAERRQAS